ncbi:hypothetical protein [Burkholderia multivorans]|uniref:hypothetical protein n=1 Tax=Burkholderia multivorans TaxID=87883 RepID=UPI00158A6C11|nr:hypothetical protein [Burkholderia multivorans]
MITFDRNDRSPSIGTTDHVQPKSLITLAEIRSQDASSTRTRRKPDVAYARLVEIAAERGLTLLTKEWVGLKSYYEFRCASGHDVTRIGTVAMRGTITCLLRTRARAVPLSRTVE